MSKHFEDTLYYLKRAGEHAKLGVKETLESLEERARELTGNEAEPEPSRVESLLKEIKAVEKSAEGEAREAVTNARTKLEAYRSAN